METALKLAILLLALSLIGCGRTDVNPEFQAYLDSFIVEASARGKTVDTSSINITFGGVDSGQMALCRHSLIQSPSIIVSKPMWDLMEEGKREAVIFHELGHCALGRGHDETKTGPHYESRPVSLMYPKAISSSQFKSYRVEYIDELFK